MSTISNQIANLSREQLAKLAYELKASKASKQQEIPKRAPGEPCPLSFAQQRLWFIAQLEPDNPFYNCIAALRITGKLNIPLLEQTFSEVVRRHEVLRTTFELVGSEPVQIVSSEFKLNPRVIDLQSLPESERERQVSKLSTEELRRPFDLTRGPLLRVVVLQVSEYEHAIVFTTHHIVFDGWSQDLLIREIIALYSAFAEGRPSPLAELPAQYADFAIWQRQRLTGPVLEGHLDYWKRHLADAPHVLALPTDHPRPAVPTRRGSYETLTLSPELSHSLRTLGRRKSVTLFMTMLGAFDVLLSRYSGQTDFLIGTDIANRNQGTTELLIGFFVNQLVLRVDLAGDPTFNEVLERVKEATLNGHAHQEAPFEKVVEMLNPERNLSHAPLFQVKLVLQNASTENLELPELAIGGVEAEGAIAKFDLTLAVFDGDRISAVMEYATDLFESSTISRMLTQLERLLASAVRDPEQHISQLDALSSAERHRLLVERNDTHVPYPRTRGIHELFEEQVALSPDAPALTFQAQHLSYAELNTRANQLAHYLRQLGVRADTPVGVCLHRSIDMVVALIAILKAGGVYVPLDPEYPAERLAFIVEDVSPPIILADSFLVDDMPSTWAHTLCLDTESELWAAMPSTDLADIVSSSDSLAYIMYTSGSTGNPKGVAVPHRGVVRLVKQSAYVDFGAGEVFLQLAPVTFDASTLEIWGALLNGGRLVLMPPGAPGLAELGRVLRSEGVTVLWLTAGLFHLMVEQELEALACVSQVVAGGDVLSADHVGRLLLTKGGSGTVVNGYGPTEATTFACCHRMSGETELEHGVPIGSPIGNTQVYVLGEKMELVGEAMVGELYLGGDGLARCYYNQPELTAERFVPHPFSTAGGERLYRTGDYVRWRADGTLEFVGRLDTQVKIRGYRVEPGEVEAVLGQHRSVEGCAVVIRREENGEKRLVAYVVDVNHEQDVNTSELREYLRKRLPEFMLPSAIVQLEELPLTANGKVDRRALGGLEVHVRGEQSYVPPRTSTEELICGVWEEVLHAERVGIDDNFFDLGGDSILTIQVIVKARAVGLELNVPQLFQYQTVHELAEELERSSESLAIVEETEPFSLISEADRGALPAGVVDAYPLTELQAGMLFHSELAPDAGQYHDIFTFHLRLPFDGEALGATLQQLLDRHPVLRTSFNFSDFSEPIQMVHEKVEVALKIEDLRDLSAAEQETVLANWMAAEKQYHFDWRQAPLIRFQIQRRAEESFQFSFSFHHAILDGWSVATMLTELFNVYAVKQAGASERAASLGTSFRDFVAAERAVLNSAEARQYWTTMLSEATQSRLPRLGERGGPARVTGHVVAITGELSRALRQLARRAGVPPKSVLLAAHLRALSVQAGSNDVLTGIVSHGRPETTDSERVLGLFLNTLPFRRRLRGGTWLELVQETFAAERELLPFRRYPMARMQQDIGNDAPLFETIFNYTHFHVYDEMQNVSGVEVLDHDGVADTNFTLAVDFSQELGGSQIRLALQYDAAELSEAQIEAVGHNYLTILESMTRRPLEHYEYQCLLSPEERQKLLYDWNDTAAAYPRELTLSKLFEAQVVRTPNALAAVLEAEQVTYDELNRRANQLGHYLQAAGVGPDVLVGILMNRSVEMIVALLAIFKAGGAYVPLDPEYPDERLRFMVRDAGLELVVTQEKLSSRLSETVVKSIRLDADWLEIANESQDNPRLLASGSNLAYIIYTSGSSGRPKGAMVPQGGVRNCLQWMQQRYELSEQDAFLMHTSLNFDPSVWEVFWPLLVGGRVVVAGAGMLESRALLSYMAEQRVSCAYFVPSQLGMLVQERGLSEVSSLRYVISGGEKLPLAVMREFQELSGAELHHSYGPTETAIAATEWTCEAGAERVLMGRPIGNTQVYVLDGQMEPLPVGVAGELYIGGVGVGRGYVGQAQLTAERFVPDQFSGQAGARLYRTGDLVRYEAEGKLEFVGRVDQQVKLRGYRIELGEIEAVLRRHAQVSAAVVVLNEADEDKRLVAYVVSEAEAGELRQYLKAQLPDYMVPSFFVALNELPLLPNGKLDRRALPAPEGISAQAAEYAAPRTATEELLTGLWESVLRVNRVGINDNFFELGGHSLLATQLVSRVREAFEVELPLRELFERPTVTGLAEQVEAALRGGVKLTAPPLVPVSREQQLPLSFAQQRLWFLDQLEANGSFYNLPAAVRLTGELDVAALERTLSEIIRRHEALRTTFVAVDGEPKQVIKPFTPVTLPVFDVSELNKAEREAETRSLLSTEAARPFDLAGGPLVRACLVRVGEDEHVALVTMHHIISDGWSAGIFIREVTALYAAYVRGEESPLDELPIQYADFAHWQRGWLQGEVLAAQLQYWREALADAPAMLELPTDRPRPKEQTFNGAAVSLVMPEELTRQLKELSQHERVTLFMTLLAAFQSLLFRHSGQSDIVVGTPIANRRYRELEDLIGFFVNTLALRASSLATLTFTELLHRVREVTLGAYAHQDLPFEKMVEELQPERDLSRNPIFQVLFALQNAPSSALELPGLRLEGEGVESRATRFDLECHLREEGTVLSGVFVYNTDLFEQTTIERLVNHFEVLLDGIVSNPQQHIDDLSLLTAAEHAQTIVDWNDTAAAYSQHASLPELFAEQVARTPDTIAVQFEDVQLTYAELHARSNQLAQHLLQLGVSSETLVGICLERSVEMVVALLAVLKTGAAYVPLDPAYPRQRIALVLEDSQVNVLLTQQHLRSQLPHHLDLVCLDTDWATIASQTEAELPSLAVADNLAYVIYTSGSTGRPKGVQISHRALINFLTSMQQAPGINATDTLLSVTTLSFDIAGLEIYLPLLNGARLVLASRETALDGRQLARLIGNSNATIMQATPATWRLLLEAEWQGSKQLKLLCGGEALPAELASRLLAQGASLWNLYGPTETTIWSALKQVETAGNGVVEIGRPIANTQLFVLNPSLQPAPVGVAGELFIGGDGLARGYFNRPELTAEGFIPDPFATTAGARLYRTGDRALYLLNGEIEFLGRVDQQVKVRGHRIELGEIEAALAQHPAVAEAVVIAREQTAGDNQLVAYVVTPTDAEALPAQTSEQQAELTSQWQMAWDETYANSSAQADPTLNLAGWNSSYTGTPIPADEMRQWVDQTVARILSLEPKRVLEIGCGTGLLLFRVARHIDHYCGTDLSAQALEYVRGQLKHHDLPEVTLSQRAADALEDLEGGPFDAVVLNSVIQYFPDVDYLIRVLEQAASKVREGGAIFIGDVRNLRLLEAFHTSVELSRAPAEQSASELRQRVQRQVRQEKELSLDPTFFEALANHLPNISRVEIQLKRGNFDNELSRFRYDVTLHVGEPQTTSQRADNIDWQAQSLTLAELWRLLCQQNHEALLITRVPNVRILSSVKSVAVVNQAEPDTTVAALRNELATIEDGVAAENVWRLVEGSPYSLEVRWSESPANNCFDLFFTRDGAQRHAFTTGPTSLASNDWRRFANNPLRAMLTGSVEPQLRKYLEERLPSYMIPAAFIPLPEMPLTPNGKIDRLALARLEVSSALAEETFVAPRTQTESIVAAIWGEVLGRETIGVHDNFFELGGHSLLATQIISRVRDAFSQEVALRSLFERPTVAGLIQSIEQQQRAGAGLLAPPLVQVTGAERLPLSFAQQRLWFLDQMEPGSSSYNIPAAVRLRGVLNIEALEQTLSEVVRRHEVLRTRFIAVDGEPVQVIDAAAPLRLEVLDLSALDEEAREADMLRRVRAEASLPFDLSRGPLLRVSLIRLHAEDHVAAVTMPHIVTDGWSMGIFINEVATLYAAYVRGDESPLEELPIQYADFAHWQRGWLQGEVLAAQLDYWRAELADAPTIIDFPVDKPRPPVQTYGGAYQPLQLSTELSAQLRDLSRRHGSTLFMMLLAAFDLLLCRYAGQEQVLVGGPIANRNRSETEGLIGFFVNTLVLRGDLRGNPSFRELLRRVRKTALSAYAHQDLPFEKLVEELQPERDMGRSPLFQVTFTWQNAPSEALELEGLSLSEVESAGDTVKFEMSLVLGERGGAIVGAMAYNRDLFEATSIERLMASYERVLQTVVTDAEQRVLEIDLLSEAERRQIIEGWNETRREYSGAVTLHELFEAQAERSGEAVAIVFAGDQLTYAELNRRANQLAHHLRSLGVSPDSLVAVCLDRSLEVFIALLAILKAGAAYLPLDPSYPLARLSFMLADAGSPLLLTTEALADELPTQWTPPLLLDSEWDVIALNPDEPLAQTVVAADQLAYVMYTSGSTGTAKGVAVTHGGVLRLVTSPNYVRLDTEQTLLQLAPLTFDASTLEVWGALLNGGRLVVMPPSAPTLDEISRVIVAEGVTTLWLTAGLFHLMVDEQLEDLSQVEQLLAGGDVLSVRHVEKYLAAISKGEGRLINGYGPTENTTFTCCQVMDGNTRLNGSVPIGKPITNTQVYVLDAEMQVVPVGVVGELYIGGAGLARGYYNQPELTAERFVPHPHSTEAGARLYRTGDMVRWHEGGELEFIGRVDGQVKVRGFRIEMGEIEAVLAGHAGVREAVVLARENERGDKRLVAYVVKEMESEVTGGELKEYLRERLPEYMQVQWVVAVEELPLTANGKVDRRALAGLEVEYEAGAGGQSVLARTPAEEILSAIWAEVLGRETVSVHDNFFELGGHSLLATQVISRVRDAFGQEVALRSLFEQPTVAGLASEIEAGRGLGAELQAPPLERVERAKRLPLSFAQQRLWFLDQLEPESSFYNIPAAVRLRGVLDIEALERTLSEVVRRHEVLRTHFISMDGEPVQVIEAAAPLRLAVLDLSGMEEEAREAEMLRLVRVEASQPFDLSRGPLLRVSLMRLGTEEHVALVMMHHIVSDGWSIGIFINEVATLYKAFTAGEESPLEELPIQYADFAHWQRIWLQGEVLAAQLEYWRAELADAPTVIDLPIDKARPPVQTYRGAYQPVALSAELSTQLRDLSRRHGSTLFMTLLAAFDVLLCRYAGQEQVLVGTPIANRNRSETEGLIGFFVNTLVLRGDLRDNPSFRELLRRVRETALGAYAHQDLPFEKLVEELQPDRDMSRSPLFQVMFVLQNAPGEALELAGLSLSGVENAGETAKFEMLLGLQEVGGVVVGSINYNRDLFEAETIGRLVASYERILQAVVADAEQSVFEIELLSEEERRQIIEGWNETRREYAPALTLSELFEAQVARTPEAVALRFEDTALSYGELNERANQLAHYLQRTGVGPDVLVGILMNRSVEMIVAVLGILKAGGAYVPLDPSYPLERLAFMVQDSGLRMLLTQELLREVAGEYVGDMLSLTQQWDLVAGESVENLASGALPENLAYVIYTSGSTGRPKGVLVSHENVVRLLEATQARFEFNQSDVWTLFHSYAFDFSVWEIWGALAYGGKLVIVPYWISRSAEAFHRLLASEQVTVLNQTPSAFRQLIAADESGGAGVELKLRLVIFGGEALELQSLRPWFARYGDHTPRLVNMFGITETTVHVTYRPLTDADLKLASSSVIGRPLGCLQVYLLDGRGQPVPIGVAAEICVGGTGLARGYLNRAELTAERFVPNPFSTSPGARLYRSGDLARFLPNGDIEYLGRIDQQVKVRGYRIELGEIETALAEHEGVRECTVVAAPDANGETRLLAYLVGTRQQPAPSVTALREFLQEKLPEYMIPAAFIVLDAIPLTPNGKIDRGALPAPDQARPQLGKEFVAPRTPVEEIMAGIWEELLDVRPVGVRDDFFSLGGHSLMAVRLMARVQASFGQHLPLASLFQGPTIEKLASLLREQPQDHSASALVGIQPKGEGLPFFCVHPGGGNVLCYRDLANHLGLERPFYGLQARGLAENQVPHTRIEEMATYYIEAIRSVQPDGPYLLGGWSMGGIIAYEMAQQLEAQGQRVSLLALMDAKPMKPVEATTPLDEITLLANFARDLGLPVDGLKLSTAELAKLDSQELLNYVLQRAIEAGIVPQDIQLALARRLFEVFKINVQAMQTYRPQASSTRVTLLKAEEHEGVETGDETMGWGALTSGKVEIHTVPGSHFTIVREPYVRSLAEGLADCIDRATLKSVASLP